MIDFDEFMKVDIRVGRVVRVEDFPEARKPAWKLYIDFGSEVGEKRSSAQIKNYTQEELEGSLVLAVVNFPPREEELAEPTAPPGEPSEPITQPGDDATTGDPPPAPPAGEPGGTSDPAPPPPPPPPPPS